VDSKTLQGDSQTIFNNSFYEVLGLKPWSSPLEIRRNYRELSKLYHPDTTQLPSESAVSKFQFLNEAYATLSNPERRALYDLQIGYSRINVIQTFPENNSVFRDSAYLDYADRSLSSGETAILVILLLTFLLCLGLVFWLQFKKIA
jgi:curved DNA-binding protein CbpA